MACPVELQRLEVALRIPFVELLLRILLVDHSQAVGRIPTAEGMAKEPFRKVVRDRAKRTEVASAIVDNPSVVKDNP